MSHGKKRQKLLVDEKWRGSFRMSRGQYSFYTLTNLGCHGINIGREFSNLFLTSSTSPNSHRFNVQKRFLSSRDFHRIFTRVRNTTLHINGTRDAVPSRRLARIRSNILLHNHDRDTNTEINSRRRRALCNASVQQLCTL